MPLFDLGLSALRTNQFALQVVSNNIANANNEGYHRRNVHLESLPANQANEWRIGSGVNIRYIERLRNQVTETSLTNVIADLSSVDQSLTIERQIESALLNGGTSVADQLDQVFAEITKLTAAPDEPAQRSAVIETGRRLTGAIRQASRQFGDLENSLRNQIRQEVEILNQQMETLNEVNIKIQNLKTQGIPHNVELDKRDTIINEIAQIVGISRNELYSGEFNLTIGHHAIQQSSTPVKFSLTESNGELALLLDDFERPLDLQGGRLAAELEALNSTIPLFEGRLDELATQLMKGFDSIHATGIGTAGSFQQLIGTRGVDDTSLPLSEAGTVLPVEAGDLTISLIDANGARRTEVVTIDPTVDSLEDVVQRINTIAGVNASLNVNSNRLQLFTAVGLSFDFTGAVETQPDLSSFGGTSLPTFSGLYTGSENDSLTFEIEGTGEVGVTDGLVVNVYSESGALTKRVNIGDGYEPGTELDVGDGIRLTLARGTVNDTDSFTTRVTAEPDETGILAALGLNSFFQGVNARTIEIDDTVANDHQRFASGKSADAADTANLFGLTSLEENRDLPGKSTLSEFVHEIYSEIGLKINANEALSSSLTPMQIRIIEERDSFSGVDINEELVHLQQFQKSYEAAVRVIQTADEMLNELFSILR